MIYHWCIGNAEVEEDSKIYNEWTPRRPWKERKRIAKASQTFSQIQEPELIFYGRHAGVVGLTKHDVYRKVNDHEISQFGYDKVNRNICLSSHVSVSFLVYSCELNIFVSLFCLGIYFRSLWMQNALMMVQ